MVVHVIGNEMRHAAGWALGDAAPSYIGLIGEYQAAAGVHAKCPRSTPRHPRSAARARFESDTQPNSAPCAFTISSATRWNSGK